MPHHRTQNQMASYLHLSICKSYASLFLERGIRLAMCNRLSVLYRDLGGVFVRRFQASENVCSVGKHLVCGGGQFVLFDVSQCPQLLADFILVFGLYGAPFTLLNKVDSHEIY